MPPEAAAAPPPPPPEPTALPLGDAHALLTSLTAFLTVSIHTVLYYRRIYPPATFLSAKAFNLAVHQNRHPKVCAWINDAVDAVATQLAAGTVDRVAIVIHAPPPPSPPSASGAAAPPPPASSSQPVLERWVFDLSHVPSWPGGAEAMRAFESVQQQHREDEGGEEGAEDEEGDDEAAAAAEAGSGGENENQVLNWVDVNEQLRGVVRRLAHAGEKLAPLPEGCTFTVAVELRDESEAPIGHPQPWIPSGPDMQRSSLQLASKASDVRRTSATTTTPIRSMEAGPLFLECWVEQGKSNKSLAKKPAAGPLASRGTPAEAR